jgi:hypothetical protein
VIVPAYPLPPTVTLTRIRLRMIMIRIQPDPHRPSSSDLRPLSSYNPPPSPGLPFPAHWGVVSGRWGSSRLSAILVTLKSYFFPENWYVSSGIFFSQRSKGCRVFPHTLHHPRRPRRPPAPPSLTPPRVGPTMCFSTHPAQETKWPQSLKPRKDTSGVRS